MNTEKDIARLSKFISLVLRHQPEIIGLTLDKNGWAKTEELLDKMTAHNQPLSLETLNQIVETNKKNRFSFNSDKTAIRANQGHSVEVDVELKCTPPPDTLYHGTAEKFVSSILQQGLLKQSRLHVHLSATKETALQVGGRHGKPVIFIVNSKAMHAAGYRFFVSENGVWLTDSVPAEYLAKSEVQVVNSE